ncbi:protein derived from transposon [Anaeramoeba ignava]|uniref:Protein derived from transposon n=1 Tax=Anaeramoeba ignava TaxID=1746090 RepID=A0A9Q0RDE7_ANAIG|nr:protein derived from transposon [Anaeramoeba ignava]
MLEEEKIDINKRIRLISHFSEIRNISSVTEKAAKVYLIGQTEKEPISQRSICEFFGISLSALQRALTALKQGREVGRKGRPPVLSDEQKKELKEKIVHSAEKGKSLNINEVLEWINEHFFDEKPSIELDFMEKPHINSRGWVYNFANQNDIIIKLPQVLERARSQVSVDEFFYQPSVTLPKIENFHTTLVVCVNAAGKSLDPLVIIPMQSIVIEETPERNWFLLSVLSMHLLVGLHKKFSQNGRSKFSYLMFSSIKKQKKRRHCLFLMATIQGLVQEVIKDFMKNQIELFVLPAHSSHFLQPLDLSVFGTFKKYLRRRGKLSSNILSFLDVYDAFQSSATIKKIYSGFNKAGIYPFDPTKVLGNENIVLKPAGQEKLKKQRKRLDINGKILTSQEMLEKVEEYEKKKPKTKRKKRKKKNYKSKKTLFNKNHD